MDDEVRFHLEARTDDPSARGSVPTPRRAARLDFGNPEAYQIAAGNRAACSSSTIWRAIRYAVRSIGRTGCSRRASSSRWRSASARRPRPSASSTPCCSARCRFDPDRLMMISPGGGRGDRTRLRARPRHQWRDGCRTCEGNGRHSGTWPTNVSGEAGDPGSGPYCARHRRFFATLGARPILGRGLPAGEEERVLRRLGLGRTPLDRARAALAAPLAEIPRSSSAGSSGGRRFLHDRWRDAGPIHVPG